MSFALRDSEEVSATTRERLQRLARARGYRADPLVTAMFSQVRRQKLRGDHRIIAYVNTWWPRTAWESCSTKTGQFRGAAQRAAELGFRLENFWLGAPGMSAPRLAQVLKARSVRGLLIGPLQRQDQRIDLPWDDFSTATIGYSLHTPVVSRACHAHFRGMYQAMDILVSRGYQRIGYVTSRDFETRVNSLWGAAFRLKQHELKQRNRIEPMVFEGEAENAGLRRWLAAARPDAIVNALPGVFELLAKPGGELPGCLGFVHLDLPNHLRTAGVSGIDQLWEISGAVALDLVANQLFTNTRGLPAHPLTQLVEGTWIEGSTSPGLKLRTPSGNSSTFKPVPSTRPGRIERNAKSALTLL
jgi:LacI family transcriptional regulator